MVLNTTEGDPKGFGLVIHRLQVHLHTDNLCVPPDVDVYPRPPLLHLREQSDSSQCGRTISLPNRKRHLKLVFVPSPPFPQGIGDSAQGFTNAILFVCFTKAVRDAFKRVLCLRCKRQCIKVEEAPINSSQLSESTKSTPAGSLLLKSVLNLEDSVHTKLST